ncbi:MAG TPA: RDD family protein [Candidatus Nanoarchaeia archaeon]|nr:RDD family protein [Candidatus Nanoarchaeia archaeon]
MEQKEITVQSLNYASWGLRVAGWLIDILITGVVILLLEIVRRLSETTESNILPAPVFNALYIVGIIWGFIYVIIMTVLQAKRGQTVGQKYNKIKVVSLKNPDKKGISAGASIVRNIFFCFQFETSLLSYVWGVGNLIYFFTKKKQTLADMVTKTIVVKI